MFIGENAENVDNAELENVLVIFSSFIEPTFAVHVWHFDAARARVCVPMLRLHQSGSIIVEPLATGSEFI